jgi:hypothetical protein
LCRAVPDTASIAAADLVSAAPEPATWGLMIVGFFGAGLAMRKSRKIGAMQGTAF